MRQILPVLLGIALLASCSGEPSRQTHKFEPRGVYSTDERLLIKLVDARRLSPTEAMLVLKLTNSEQQVAGSATVDPTHFYISPEGSTAEPVASVEMDRTTLKHSVLAIHQSVEGRVFLKTPGVGAMVVYYGDTPNLSVRLGTIPAV